MRNFIRDFFEYIHDRKAVKECENYNSIAKYACPLNSVCNGLKFVDVEALTGMNNGDIIMENSEFYRGDGLCEKYYFNGDSFKKLRNKIHNDEWEKKTDAIFYALKGKR